MSIWNDKEYKDPVERMKHYDAVDYDRKWIDKIPPFHFPEAWPVKMCPPFSGAVVRFTVEMGTKFYSVYLDCYNYLGNYNMKPYWELYYRDSRKKVKDYDTERFSLGDETKLVEFIKRDMQK